MKISFIYIFFSLLLINCKNNEVQKSLSYEKKEKSISITINDKTSINNKEIEKIILKDPEGAGSYEKGKILANKTCFYQLALEKNVIEGKRTELTFYNDKD